MTDTENNLTSSATTQDMPRFLIALLAAAPYVFFHLIYIFIRTTFLGWALVGWRPASEKLGLVILVFILWAVYLVFELSFRRSFPSEISRRPWFSLAGICFLLITPLVGVCVRPVVLSVPRWHDAEQTVEWYTDKPNDTSGGYHRYYIHLEGYGNPPNYTFTYAFINWSGDVSAGMNGINPQELTVSGCEGDDWKTYPLTLQAIRNRIHDSGLSDEQVAQISEGIWSILQQARAGKPLQALDGHVKPATSIGSTWNQEFILGGIVWMILLTSVFQFVGYVTICKPEIRG
ncbi:MAG: hypothetical protein FVQ79_04120 [Planctomycetes bacterium]|nr:hypothetical protein [Planctomycetota bacterium]